MRRMPDQLLVNSTQAAAMLGISYIKFYTIKTREDFPLTAIHLPGMANDLWSVDQINQWVSAQTMSERD